MGTRSLTVFIDENGQEIVVMYTQYDGYLQGYGKELVEFLQGMKLVNGIPYKDPPRKFANGMQCLAAQVVAHFKNEVGNVYLWPAGKRGLGEEYIYEVSGKEGEEIYITATRGCGNCEVLLSGRAKEVLDKINELK